jgi:cell division protein FtsB
MRELQQKQKMKKRLYSLPALAALLVVTVLILHGTYGVLKKQRESAMHVKELEAKVEALSNRQAELKTDISKLQTDEGIDTEIKTKFSVTREGEHVAVIVDPKDESDDSATTTPHWYSGIIDKFFSLW